MLTPAISVLAALESLELVAPGLEGWAVPIALAILVALAALQSHGTGSVSVLFGPITMLWFPLLAAAGIVHLRDDPTILAAVNPLNAAMFLIAEPARGLHVVGSVFLAVTGAGALYADLGHFGRGPIRVAWLGLVFPALALDYLGQGALVLAQPEAGGDPFFHMFAPSLLLPVVILATAATVISGRAVITGAFSLTSQAIKLGLLPRLEIRFTSAKHAGQIMPRVSLLLLIGVVGLVALFRPSQNLASAYGMTVSGTMVVTAALLALAAPCRHHHVPALPCDRPLLPRRQPPQVRRGRVVKMGTQVTL